MEALLPDLLDSLLSLLDEQSFMSFGCTSTRFYDAICATHTKPPRIKKFYNSRYSDIDDLGLELFEHNAVLSGHVRLLPDTMAVETLSVEFLITHHLYDVLKERHANGTLVLPEDFTCLFDCLSRSHPTAQFLYWFFTTFPDAVEWLLPGTGDIGNIICLIHILDIVFLSHDRHDLLVEFVKKRRRRLLDEWFDYDGIIHRMPGKAHRFLRLAIKNDRVDTLKWIHECRPDEMESLTDETPFALGGDRQKGRPECVSFVLENSRCTFSVIHAVDSVLKSKEPGQARDVFIAYIDSLDRRFQIPYDHFVLKNFTRKVTVASYRIAKEVLVKMLRHRGADVLSIGVAEHSLGKRILHRLTKKCDNFAVFRFLIQEEKIQLIDWPYLFFCHKRELHGQDLKYFKLLLLDTPEGWAKFVSDDEKSTRKKYGVLDTRSFSSVYHFITLAGAEDPELYRAYCREMGRPCQCCLGKCISQSVPLPE